MVHRVRNNAKKKDVPIKLYGMEFVKDTVQSPNNVVMRSVPIKH